MNVKELSTPDDAYDLRSELPESVVKILLQSIFNNTGGEVVVNKDGKREILGTPTEMAILEFGLSLGGDFHMERRASKVVKVEPFNSTKKRMGIVLELTKGGLRAHTPKFANEALRTLCLAYTELENGFSAEDDIPASGYTCIGIVGIKDPVRPGVRESVALCRSAGVTVRMVTGDNINTAKAIARECGILTDDGLAIEGPVFREKSLEELLELIPKIQFAVTGDGTNDAPALHEADIGLAMGIAGTEVAKESADVIIMDDNFSTIVTVAKWGRSVYVNIQKFVQFQLTVNIVALVVNFSSACLTGSAPLTAVQLLWVNMIMDTLGALALATEPPTEELMKKSPVGRKGNFISAVMWRNILGQSLYQFLVIWFLQAYGKTFFRLHGCSDSDLILNTIIFNTFVFCQLFNEVNSREMEKVNVLKGILNNYVFVSVLGSTVLFQIIIIEYLGTFANTTPLTLMQWLVCVFIGFLGMPIAVVLKLIPL
ncbi:UNVERIFIED_CONTAM: Calcium-transporting ATPase 2, plasma membrane-type [Sesamum calycinum]|uniref:Calcium-transporting ATPase 2, plasma membrane-type n=1 Tax=Sesamum calycinum TaxID=2727403 RepID=A0AAW2STK1_9LAMI